MARCPMLGVGLLWDFPNRCCLVPQRCAQAPVPPTPQLMERGERGEVAERAVSLVVLPPEPMRVWK